jgi:glycosyltransferase involved in cell wall biosynthesis
LKKRVYWTLVARPAFDAVRVIHAITPLEKEHLATLFKDREIALIPNAVDLDEIDPALASLPSPVHREPTVAFLGRFHPKKGVDILIRAFGEADLRQEWRLVLAGPPGTPAYMKELADLVARSPARDRITLAGPVFGEAKWRFYQSAGVVAVPSRSEVIGMVNLEAAACGTPTITTHDTGLLDWESGGGILIRPEVRDLAQALNAMCSAGTEERDRRSQAARRLVENRYSWAAVRELWLNLYQTVI